MPVFRHLPAATIERLHGLSVSPRRAVAGSRQGAHRAARHGASVEFAEFRDYAPGDPPSLIDWSVYARTDRHLVRRFEAETDLTGWVLLDASASMAWQGGRGGADETTHGSVWAAGCRLAAALLYLLVRQGDRAGLAVLRDGVAAHCPPAASIATLAAPLAELERQRPHGRHDLGAAVAAAAGLIPRRAVAMLVSDCLQPVVSLAGAVQRLHHQGCDVRVFQLCDPALFELPAGGLAVLEDAESGERVEADCDELRASWRAAVEAHIADLRRACHACPCEHRLVMTDQPVDAALRDL